jgi:hypothetical protein
MGVETIRGVFFAHQEAKRKHNSPHRDKADHWERPLYIGMIQEKFKGEDMVTDYSPFLKITEITYCTPIQ